MYRDYKDLCNFAAWLVLTGVATALIWTGKAPFYAMLPSITWLLPTVDWMAVFTPKDMK